jgi:hypothetical protein
MKHIEKIEKQILELFCGVDNGQIDCESVTELKLTEILRSSHTSFVTDLIKRVEEERKVYAPDTTERLFIDPVAVDGFNTALDTIIKMLKEEI